MIGPGTVNRFGCLHFTVKAPWTRENLALRPACAVGDRPWRGAPRGAERRHKTTEAQTIDDTIKRLPQGTFDPELRAETELRAEISDRSATNTIGSTKQIV